MEKKERTDSDFLTYRTRDGEVADFHSLRHTFITNLVNAGAQPKDAKELARHSTIVLTMDRYSHVGLRDTAAAVATLILPTGPKTAPEATDLRLTGTDNTPLREQHREQQGAAEGDYKGGRLRIVEEPAGVSAAEALENEAVEEHRGESETEEESTPGGT